MPTWSIDILDRFGANVVPLANAVPVSISDRLNEPRRAVFRIGVKDPDAIAADLTNCVIRRDARIKRNGVTQIWGPITRVEADRSVVTVQVTDPLWHFDDLYFGPIRNNYVTNPNAASGLSGWSAVNVATFAADTADFVKRNADGSGQSFLLIQPTYNLDGYQRQYITVTSNVGQAVVFTLAGWAKIDAANWIGPAYGERGLYIGRAGSPTAVHWDPITEATPRGTWEHFETEITVPASTTDTLEVRAYAVGGRIRWGGLSLSVYESVGTPQFPEDAIHPITRVINMAQDASQGYPALNVTKAGGLTGTNIEIQYQYNEAANIGEALADYTRKGICDLGVTYADPSTRTLEVFSPRRGSFRSAVLLDIDVGGSLADFTYRVDGEQTYSAVRVMGVGDGPDREAAFATDYAATGGIRREKREDAPSDTPVADLDRLAGEELSRAKAPVRIPTLTTHQQSGDLIGVLSVGDTARCRINHGCVVEDTPRRIVGWELDCRAETMVLEVAV